MNECDLLHRGSSAIGLSDPLEEQPDRGYHSSCTPDETATIDELPLDSPNPPQVPWQLRKLDHYEVLEVVGRGGMGIVLKAFDTKLQRVVALKVMASDLVAGPAGRRRFIREARAAARVRNQHVVVIHAVEEASSLHSVGQAGKGRAPGFPYLVMEYIPGCSLKQRLQRDAALELKAIVRVGMQTAEGLAAAHAQGLVHRDIKPGNILLEEGTGRVVITDFGLARGAHDTALSRSKGLAGTPQYMAPEQASNKAVDHRADLFSLGSVLYAMCTGKSPFRATNPMATLKRVCDDTPTPIKELNPDIPDWLVAIIARLHAKDPAKRFSSAEDVAVLLGRHLSGLEQPALISLPAFACGCSHASARNGSKETPSKPRLLRPRATSCGRGDHALTKPCCLPHSIQAWAMRRTWPAASGGTGVFFSNRFQGPKPLIRLAS